MGGDTILEAEETEEAEAAAAEEEEEEEAVQGGLQLIARSPSRGVRISWPVADTLITDPSSVRSVSMIALHCIGLNGIGLVWNRFHWKSI